MLGEESSFPLVQRRVERRFQFHSAFPYQPRHIPVERDDRTDYRRVQPNGLVGTRQYACL